MAVAAGIREPEVGPFRAERGFSPRRPPPRRLCRHNATIESHAAFPGRSTRMKISNVNETIGAHDGAVTAIVIASLTPITVPATNGPSALPRPPSITAANTTPIHA